MTSLSLPISVPKGTSIDLLASLNADLLYVVRKLLDTEEEYEGFSVEQLSIPELCHWD